MEAELLKSKIVPKEPIPPIEKEGCIMYEEGLPFPFVHYPSPYVEAAFFSYQKTKDHVLFHCACQKEALELYLYNLGGFYGIPKAVKKSMIQGIVDSLYFQEGLCHICNKICPRYGYGKEFNKTKFHSIYGYFINALAYEYGVSPHGEIIAPERIPTDIVPLLSDSIYKNKRLDASCRIEFMRYCEDVIRIRMGYFAIGKRWTTEIKLLELVRKLYPNYTVIHQQPIKDLLADIYIDELKLVIEYQGEQHYKPFSFMGGEEALLRTQERDLEKAKLCKAYEIDIIYFSYIDTITEKFVKQKISTYLDNKK